MLYITKHCIEFYFELMIQAKHDSGEDALFDHFEQQQVWYTDALDVPVSLGAPYYVENENRHHERHFNGKENDVAK